MNTPNVSAYEMNTPNVVYLPIPIVMFLLYVTDVQCYIHIFAPANIIVSYVRMYIYLHVIDSPCLYFGNVPLVL